MLLFIFCQARNASKCSIGEKKKEKKKKRQCHYQMHYVHDLVPSHTIIQILKMTDKNLSRTHNLQFHLSDATVTLK